MPAPALWPQACSAALSWASRAAIWDCRAFILLVTPASAPPPLNWEARLISWLLSDSSCFLMASVLSLPEADAPPEDGGNEE